MKTRARATIITFDQLHKGKLPLPKAFTDAIGILKGKNIDPLKCQKKIRQEWEKRFKKQVRLARRK